MRSSEEIARRAAKLKAKLERLKRGPVWVKCAECGRRTTRPKFCSATCCLRFHQPIIPPVSVNCAWCGAKTVRPKYCSDPCRKRFNNRTVLPLPEYRRLGGIRNPIYSAFKDHFQSGFYRFNRG